MLKTRSWSLLTTPSKSSPSEAMMGVLFYVILDEVAFGLERKLVCPASRVVWWMRRCKTASRPRGKMRTSNMRLERVRVIEIFRKRHFLRVEGLMRSSCFATLAVVQKPNQLSTRPNPSSPALAFLYEQPEPTSFAHQAAEFQQRGQHV